MVDPTKANQTPDTVSLYVEEAVKQKQEYTP